MATISKKNSPSTYLFSVGFTTMLLLSLVVSLNYVTDPYFIHQWDSPLLNRLAPAQQKLMPWAKTYAAYRFQPEIVYLGSSRTEIGLPVDEQLFADKRVFNLAISGASLGDAANMLKHTAFFHQPSMVIWGLDYGWQFREKSGNTDFNNELIAKSSSYPLVRTFHNLKRSLSMAMTGDTLNILLGRSEKSCKSLLAYYGHKASPCLEVIMRNEGGTKKAFEEVQKKKAPLSPPTDVVATIHFLEQITKEHCQNGTAFRFFIQPIHALAELSYWNTLEDDLGNWKRALVTMVDTLRQEGCDIQLFDFSGFNRITTEDIPQITGKDNMQHYWEQSHYRGEVGRQILEELVWTGKKPLNDAFGIELRGDTIEKYLANYHLMQGKYITEHPEEMSKMKR